MKKRWIALLLLAVLLLPALGCSKVQLRRPGQEGQSAQAEQTEQTEQTPAAIADDRSAIAVETSCGSLQYPLDWEGLFTTQETETDYGTSVTFSADYDGAPIALFTLNIGGGEGQPVGTLTASDGTERSVNMVISELMLEGADADTANRLFAMQEDVNYVIEHLN